MKTAPSYFHPAAREEQHGPSSSACHHAGHGVLGGPSASASTQQRECAHPPRRKEHDWERGYRASPRTPGTRGRPPPASCPAGRQSQHPRPERPPPPRERSLGYHRPSARPAAEGDGARAPGRATKRPGPTPRHGGGAATGLTGPERRRDSPNCRSLAAPAARVRGLRRGHRTRHSPAEPLPPPRRAAPCRLNVPAPPPSASGSEEAYGPRQGPEGLRGEALALRPSLTGQPRGAQAASGDTGRVLRGSLCAERVRVRHRGEGGQAVPGGDRVPALQRRVLAAGRAGGRPGEGELRSGLRLARAPAPCIVTAGEGAASPGAFNRVPTEPGCCGEVSPQQGPRQPVPSLHGSQASPASQGRLRPLDGLFPFTADALASGKGSGQTGEKSRV